MGREVKATQHKPGTMAASQRKAPLKKEPLKIVGWREWVAFPEFGGPSVRAKVDTGARTSAIHARNVKITMREGREIAEFDIYPHQRDSQTVLHCRAPIVARRRIRNSGGDVQDRVIVRTTIRLGEDVFEIDLSLTRRDQMGYRMLLGRRALKKRYVVDSGRSYVQGPSKSGRRRKPDLRKSITGGGSVGGVPGTDDGGHEHERGDETNAQPSSPLTKRRAK